MVKEQNTGSADRSSAYKVMIRPPGGRGCRWAITHHLLHHDLIDYAYSLRFQ